MEKILTDLGSQFKTAGFELYLIGGAVRHILQNTTPDEYDFTTNASPDQIKTIINKSKPEAVYTVGEKFGTIGARFNDVIFEITTFRGEKYTPGSRHPDVFFSKTLEEDLSRRDFTINAIAQNLETKTFMDPYHGRADLEHKLIRVVGESPARFQEDPLRLLRAVRFAASLDFTIEPKTALLIKQNAQELGSISAERIASEIEKILISKNPSNGIRLLSDFSLLPYMLPEFVALQHVQHELDEHKDIYEHTLTVLDRVSSTKRLRWLALLHDIAKPQTKKVIKGEVHFVGHEVIGEKMAEKILTRLHYDRLFINQVSKLIRLHLRVNQYLNDWTDGAIRRLMREANDLLEDLIEFSFADITSARDEKVAKGHERIEEFKERVKKIESQEEVAKIKSPLSGKELMDIFKQPPGPWIQKIKDYLLELVLDDKLAQNDQKTAIKISHDYAQSQKLFRN